MTVVLLDVNMKVGNALNNELIQRVENIVLHAQAIGFCRLHQRTKPNKSPLR